MKFLKVAVVHFLPLEKYPPVMNVLIYLKEVTRFQIRVYTTEDKCYKKKVFEQKGVIIYRLGTFYRSQSFIRRYINYFAFNFFSFFWLVITKPSSIICYEILSVFPVYLYKKIRPSTKIYIHYHEYSSPTEISNASSYLKFLDKIQKRLLSKAFWISHTNEERLSMFKKDNNSISFSNLQVLPNYPPSNWYNVNKTPFSTKTFPVKFVYVGALSMETMYTREFAEWIKELNGKATWDIYSANYQEEVLNYLKNLNSPFIRFKGEVNYFDLPSVLTQYDIGLILYNGHIPNYVYNAPNKLFEYHACNLDVWVSADIKGSLRYTTKDTFPKIISIDFSRLDMINFNKLIERETLNFHQGSYYCENVFESIKNKL